MKRSRIVRRATALILLLIPATWYGLRHQVLPHEWTVGLRGWMCLGLSWLAMFGAATLWFKDDDRPEA